MVNRGGKKNAFRLAAELITEFGPLPDQLPDEAMKPGLWLG